ncbi:hypothetical protein JCM3765_007320 [Sporobolomyces pararoseus]
MESLISETSLPQELAAFKATAGLLATQKIRYSSNYVPPLQDRHRKATLVNVPVCEPPSTSNDETDEAGASDDKIQLTIKSLKPPLTFEISASPTSTIHSLKQQLADSHGSKGAPGVEGQRWILKGKSMGDQKLLKEFNVQDGAVINLMVTKTAAVPTTTKSSSDDPEEATAQAVPSLTLSEPSASTSSSSDSTASTTKPSISLDNLPPASPSSASAHSSAAYRERIQQPELWEEIRSLLEKRFEGVENKDAECQQAWEAMLGGCQEWIDPGKKALIREKVGYSAMGGY